MVEGICDIDKQRLATRAVIVRQGNREMELELCEYHYNQLRLQQEQADSIEGSFAGFVSQLGFLPDAKDKLPEADVSSIVSDATKESIQHAAQTAVAFGRREVDTEHLLHALAGSNPGKKLLGKSGRKAKDIRTEIEAKALRTERPANPDEPIELTVSPLIRPIFDTAIRASLDLGGGRIEPEHLLIGIAQEPKGMGGEVLRSHGLTARALREQTLQKTKR